MPRVISIVHFYKDKDKGSKLVVDEYGPEVNDDGFVDEGYFYVSISKGEQRLSMKLSEAEAALLAVRLMAAVRAHATQFMDVQAMQSMKKGKG